MNVILICTSELSDAPFFSRRTPLALLPLLGRSALDRMMSRIAGMGAKRVLILAADRPEMVRAAVHHGKPWGLDAEVLTETHDLSVEEARAKYQQGPEDWQILPLETTLTPYHQDDPHSPAQNWFENVISSMNACGHDALGMRELQPGVWVGLRARVSQSATLNAPCWIGQNATVSASATIGPRAVIEKRAYVDHGAEVVESIVAPMTYVGSGTELRQSIAFGQDLHNWATGSTAEVPDAFLLADLSNRLRLKNGNWLSRLAALFALIITSPVLLAAWWSTRKSRQPLFAKHRAVKAPTRGANTGFQTVPWLSFNGLSGWWKRWPELLNIVRGEFTWVGNRPLTCEQAEELQSECDHLWLSVAPGMFSLADVSGCADHALDDAARIHAAFYSVSASVKLDAMVLWRAALLGLREIFSDINQPHSTHTATTCKP